MNAMFTIFNTLGSRFHNGEQAEITGGGAKGLIVTIRSAKPINVCDTHAWLQREGYAVGEVIWLRTEETLEETIARLQKELADAKDMLSDAIDARCCENFISRRLSHKLDDLQKKHAEALRQCEAERAAHEETKREMCIAKNVAVGTALHAMLENAFLGMTADPMHEALKAERAAHEETKRKLELVRNDRNREIDTTRAVNERLRAERSAHEKTRQLLKERLRVMGGNGRLYIEEKAAHEETKRKLELARQELCWIRAIDRHL